MWARDAELLGKIVAACITGTLREPSEANAAFCTKRETSGKFGKRDSSKKRSGGKMRECGNAGSGHPFPDPI